jgi:uncharacterized membrane-anchored protein
MIGRVIANEQIANNYFDYVTDDGWELYPRNKQEVEIFKENTIKKCMGMAHKAFFNSSIFSLLIIYFVIAYFQFKTWIAFNCLSVGLISLIVSGLIGGRSLDAIKPEFLHHIDILSARGVYIFGYFLLIFSYLHQEKQEAEYSIESALFSLKIYLFEYNDYVDMVIAVFFYAVAAFLSLYIIYDLIFAPIKRWILKRK